MLNRFFYWLFTPSRSKAELQFLRHERERDRQIIVAYAGALRDIINTTDAVKVPNGTTKKLARIAHGAFDTAMRTVAS